MLIYRFMFIAGVCCLSFCGPAVAMYSIPETRVVPIERLISNLEESLPGQIKDSSARARKVHQLARLCAMAYALKLSTAKQFVPDKHSNNDDPDFASIYPPASPYGEIGDDPREVPDPETGGNGAFLDKAIKYYKIYLDSEPKDWRGHMGLGWAHLLKGNREEAKKSLRFALNLAAPSDAKVIRNPHSFFGGDNIDAYAPESDSKIVFQDLLFPAGSKKIGVIQANGQKQMLDVEKAALDSLKASASVAFVGEYSGLLPKFKEFVRDWEKNRSPLAYKKFSEFLPGTSGDFSYGGSMRQNDFEPSSYSFKSQFSEFGVRFVNRAQPAGQGGCSKLKGIAQFQEFSILNSEACLIQKAFKEKNWGICRIGMADGIRLPFAFDVCISALAARSKNKKVCEDVKKFLGSLYRGFDFNKCESSVSEGWKATFMEDYYTRGMRNHFPRFIDSFDTYTTTENDGAFRLIAKFTRQGGVTINHLILRSPQSHWQSEGQEKERRYSLPKAVAIRMPHKISFSSKDGRVVGSAELSGFFMPTDSDFIKRAENYDISSSLGTVGSAEIARYLVPLLDKDKDAQEITEVKRRVWKTAVNYAMSARAVTPLALPLRGLKDSGFPVSREAIAEFDLDGSGLRQSWEWIKPNYGWLVYLPENSKVTSAIQMFGSVTFWLFWRDGFESLCSLDDNQDGAIRGTELSHIKIWNDRDLNGVQGEDELLDLEKQGISGLKCEGAEVFSQGLRLPGGVELKSGSSLDLYDVWLKKK